MELRKANVPIIAVVWIKTFYTHFPTTGPPFWPFLLFRCVSVHSALSAHFVTRSSAAVDVIQNELWTFVSSFLDGFPNFSIANHPPSPSAAVYCQPLSFSLLSCALVLRCIMCVNVICIFRDEYCHRPKRTNFADTVFICPLPNRPNENEQLLFLTSIQCQRCLCHSFTLYPSP